MGGGKDHRRNVLQHRNGGAPLPEHLLQQLLQSSLLRVNTGHQ